MFGRRLLAVALLGTPAGLLADEPDDAAAIRRQDLERHITFLASDTLEGREAGSRGGLAARQYLIGELKKFGLTPAGDDGRYIQDFVPNYCNVLGLLPAQGPDASDDVVLIGAHYDHVGYGRSTNSQGPIGYIHNGADDNASG
ncbi:MAG: M28 family peptidase, partial [Planctomycetaceae bacterium]|nr:M28 family peptidase [Planctomycetaceae bacterium]